MSPRGRTVSRRRRNALIGGAGLIGAIAAIVSIYSTGGQDDLIPPVTPGADVLRIDLLATRDLDTTTPCGLPAGGGGGSNNKPLVSDQTWTRTGGSSCYPISLTTAQCFDATEIPYTVDATGIGWAVEPDGVNRVLYSVLAGGIDCTNWTCLGSGTATPGQTAPDGSATASLITVNGSANSVYTSTGTGYSNSVTLYPRVWVKCTANTFAIENMVATGYWSVTCATTSAGAWVLINDPANQAGVTEVGAWTSTATGTARVKLSGNATACSVWAPTLTEEPGTGLAVIPTGVAASSTGDISWSIANGLRDTGAQLLVDGDMEAATTVAYTAAANTILTKDTATPHGGVRSLRVTADGGIPYAYQTILTIGTMTRVIGWGAGDGTRAPSVRHGATDLWIGSTSAAWQSFDVTFIAGSTELRLYNNGSAGYSRFDDITVYVQESWGPYYRAGDTVTTSLSEISGTCWDVTSSVLGDLLLTGVPGSECSGVWYSLQVSP